MKDPKGECKMRAVFILLVSVTVGFGFLLSDNFHTREELSQIKAQNTLLIRENVVLRNERDAAIANLVAIRQEVVQLAEKNTALEMHIQKLDSDIQHLQIQNTNLQNKVDGIQPLESPQPSRPNPIGPALLLPIFPASIAVTYLFVRKKKQQTQPNQVKPDEQRRTSVQLTDREVQKVIEMRRAK